MSVTRSLVKNYFKNIVNLQKKVQPTNILIFRSNNMHGLHHMQTLEHYYRYNLSQKIVGTYTFKRVKKKYIIKTAL